LTFWKKIVKLVKQQKIPIYHHQRLGSAERGGHAQGPLNTSLLPAPTQGVLNVAWCYI